MKSPPALPARYYGLLRDMLQQMGCDVARMERAAGIAPTAPVGQEPMLSMQEVEALLVEAAACTGRDDLGFELGRRIKLSTHDILGFGLLASATLDTALRLAARFQRLVTRAFAMHYRRDSRVAEISFQPILPMAVATLRFHLEAIAVSFHEQLGSLLGLRLRRYHIQVSGPVPAHRRYRELSPAKFRFDHEALAGVRIVMDATMVDQPLAMADRHALATAEAHCEALQQRATATGSATDWVRMMLREAREHMPTLKDLAQVLRVGPHTLDRRLRKEGQRFLDLSMQVRHERACALLERSGTCITQIAYQLGYANVANFTRAFRRASGISPSGYQARNGAHLA